MKQVAWGRLRIYILASVILIGVGVCGADAEDLGRIVVFRDGTSVQTQQAVVQRSGSRVLNILSLINGLAIALPADRAAQALQALQADPSVVGVYTDPTIAAQGAEAISAQGAGGDLVVYIQPAAAPAQEVYPWGLDLIGVPDVRQNVPGLDGSGVKIAVLDTGVYSNHPDLKGNLIGGVNARALEVPGNFQDDNGHGTHVTGIIAARANKVGVIGAAPKVKIYAIKVLDQNGAGKVSDLISGLGWVRANNIKLVNMSLGFPQEWGPYPLLEQAIKYLYDAGVIMVAAAGNRNPSEVPAQGAGGDGAGGDGTCPSSSSLLPPDEKTAQGAGGDGAGGDGTTFCYLTTKVKDPAAYPWVIAVGATDEDDKVTVYSRSGPEMTDHGVVAPGGKVAPDGSKDKWILSTNKGGGYGLGIGTSQATAHVTGTIALALQLQPNLSFKDVLALLKSTATNVLPFAHNPPTSEWEGGGRIDAENLVEALKTQHQGDDHQEGDHGTNQSQDKK